MEDVGTILQFFRPEGVVPAAFVLILTWAIARLLAEGFDRLGRRFIERRLTLQHVKSMFGLVVYLAGLAAAVPLIFQLSSEARLALGGALAVAIGIALRDLVASIIAGITILLDKPFSVGDRISYGDVYGEVVEIGLRAVRVLTLENELVTIPNSKFLTDVVASGNAGQLDKLVSMDFFVGADQSLRAAKRIVGEALASSRYTYLKKPWRITISTVQDSGIFAVRLRARVFAVDVRYERALESDVTERVIEAFQEQGIKGPIALQRELGTSSDAPGVAP